jgi:hypothetical protein
MKSHSKIIVEEMPEYHVHDNEDPGGMSTYE